MTNRITADEAKRLLDAATPGPWFVAAGDRVGPSIVAPGRKSVVNGDCDTSYPDKLLLASAPDLAETVIAQAEEIERLLRIVDEHEPDQTAYNAMSGDPAKGGDYARGWEDCAISIRQAMEARDE